MENKPTYPTKRKPTETDQQQSPSIKTSRITSKYRFTDLPHAIVLHILSFATVKDAIRICSLSRQWKSLWTSLSNLSFVCEKQNSTDFALFIDKALSLYSFPKVKILLLEFPYDDRFKKQVKSWIRFSVTHEVEELYLHFTGMEALFYSKVFDWFDNWCGMSLKVLSLVSLKLGKEVITDIFQGSPLLECLKLQHCLLIHKTGGNCVIDVSNTRLKILVLDRCAAAECKYERTYLREGFLEIKGPDLVSLTVQGYMSFTKLKLIDVSSLVEANITFWVDIYIDKDKEEKTLVKGVLEKLLHVNRLAIGTWFLQVLANMNLDGENFSPFTRCKILEINVWSSKWYYSGMEFLLQNSPSLEQLIINGAARDVHTFGGDRRSGKESLEAKD